MQATTVLTRDEIPQDVREHLNNSTALCHDAHKRNVTGGACITCPYFGGLFIPQETQRESEAHKRYRGICRFPLPRRLTQITISTSETRTAVRCPDAAKKVSGANRFQLINARHCNGCADNCGEFPQAVSIRCSARKGITFQPYDVRFLE